ncbi:hypothetical protein I7I48_04148 [Histoplasma ohiense]|nr:hypothetical protein I7I48_04148 [Histoplasma ohiense (nom. inval.)]
MEFIFFVSVCFLPLPMADFRSRFCFCPWLSFSFFLFFSSLRVGMLLRSFFFFHGSSITLRSLV